MCDQDAINEVRKLAGGDKETVLLHYLYLPKRDAAVTAAMALESLGFAVESRLSADGINWLLLASHTAVPDENSVARARALFEEFARNGDGEYDGWEAEIRPLATTA